VERAESGHAIVQLASPRYKPAQRPRVPTPLEVARGRDR